MLSKLLGLESDSSKDNNGYSIISCSHPEFIATSECKLPVICELRDELCFDDAKKLSEAIALAYQRKQPYLLYYINSPGGDVSDALEIVHLMTASPVPIYTVNVGCAASAAFTIFCHGKRRFMAQHARLMLHDVSVDFSARTKGADMKTESAEMERLLEILLGTAEENCQLPKHTFQNMLKENHNADKYILLEEAIKLNIATDTGIPWNQIDIQINIEPVLMNNIRRNPVSTMTHFGSSPQSLLVSDLSSGCDKNQTQVKPVECEPGISTGDKRGKKRKA